MELPFACLALPECLDLPPCMELPRCSAPSGVLPMALLKRQWFLGKQKPSECCSLGGCQVHMLATQGYRKPAFGVLVACIGIKKHTFGSVLRLSALQMQSLRVSEYALRAYFEHQAARHVYSRSTQLPVPAS